MTVLLVGPSLFAGLEQIDRQCVRPTLRCFDFGHQGSEMGRVTNPDLTDRIKLITDCSNVEGVVIGIEEAN